jgi:hypothetical protein
LRSDSDTRAAEIVEATFTKRGGQPMIDINTDPEKAERDRLASGRSCGSCSLCCKLLSNNELAKPRGKWCAHCTPGGGCRIYGERPEECRTFYCSWLVGFLPPEWYPQRSKMVASTYQAGGLVFCFTVDPAYPNRWREEPWYSQLKQMSATFLRRRINLHVRVGRHYFAIFPSSEVDIGEHDDEAPFPHEHLPALKAAWDADQALLK